MILTAVEILRILKAWTDEERRKPLPQRSPVLDRELRLTADVFILQSQCERATQAWLRGQR